MSDDFPSGWGQAQFCSVVVNHDGRRRPVKSADRAKRQGPFPYFGASGVIDHVDGYLFDGSYLLIAEDGANLLSRSTPIAFQALGKFWVNNHAHIVKPCDGVSLKYLERFLNSIDLAPFVTGSAQPKLTQKALDTIPLPIAPTAEQHRIAAKIDSLFARSSQARDELAHIPRLIERYRQAVLGAAFRGDLTADWRESHPLGNPTQHLGKVLSDRRDGWLAAQASSRRRNYPEPEEADWFPDIELPDGWAWASVDQLTTEMQYGTSAKTNEDANGVPVLRMGNIVRGELQVENLKYLPADHDEFPALLLQQGDILFNRTNSPELVGKSAVFRDQLPKASFASYLIRLKAVGIIPALLSAYINSPYGRAWVRSVVSQQVGQANVNGTKLSHLAVPLIPDDEQIVLDQRIAQMMAAIDTMEHEMLRATGLIDRLDQSILDKAFTGKLVPQDPADEPASKLLERITAARESAPKTKRGRKQR
ncbi:restriction endonuclease subunit S [Magnetospirillum sp. 15-1]|uniref:restriction endonuclease subunit S n=1 Tax=Magnetospirillum sp. 15-1 TaxID=1979370 RepID=UPI000BBBCB37|nr:restriction endonuclease subunit S [Magnetospirillum sp. 15-1]